LVKAVSRDIYNQKAVMKVESISKHHLESGSVREHVVFIVELQNAEDQKKELEKAGQAYIYPLLIQGYSNNRVYNYYAKYKYFISTNSSTING
jgi:hypothetical protein